MSDEERGKIRGFVCEGFARFYQEQRGLEATARLMREGLEPEYRERFDPERLGFGFLPSAWYPGTLVHRMLDVAFADVAEKEALEFSGYAGRHVFKSQITGLQRAAFGMLLSPDRLVKFSAKTWRHNFGSGDVAYETGPRRHTSTYTNWDEHHLLLCEAMMLGKIEIYVAMGVRDPRVAVSSRDPGQGCTSTTWWGERSEDEPLKYDMVV